MDGRASAALPHVRAALIGLALIASGIHALPLPAALTQTEIEEEWRQNDIDMWRGWFGSAGVELSEEWIEQFLLRLTGVTGQLRSTLEAPFEPVFDVLAIDQSWALFASATTRPDRLVVQIQRGEQWSVLYRRLDPCCTWHDDPLRYRRIRGIWDGQKERPRPAYRRLTPWVADQVFADFADVDAVRVELERIHTTYPWAEPDPEIEIRHQRSHRRPSR